MKRLERGILVLMAAAFLCTVSMPASAYARPKTVDLSKAILKSDYIPVYVQIGDMIFQGRIIDKSSSDEVIDKLIEEVLKEMGLTEAEFDKLNTQQQTPLTDQEKKERMENLATALGGGVGGKPASIGVEILADILYGTDEMTPGKYAKLLRKIEVADSDTVRGFWISLDEYAKLIKDISAYGKEGGRGYAILQSRIFYLKLYNKLNAFRAPEWAIEFKDAKATKPFQLFKSSSISANEIWTLNMTLKFSRDHAASQPQRNRRTYEAVYQGSYTIDIEYNISKLLPSALAEWIDKWMITAPDAISSSTSVANNGSIYAKRTLAGEALAEVVQRNDGGRLPYTYNNKYRITPTQKSDVKNVGASGIMLNSIVTSKRGSYIDCTYEFTADENALYMHHTEQIIYANNATWEGPSGTLDTLPWEEYSDMYERGDNAGKGWNLKIAGN